MSFPSRQTMPGRQLLGSLAGRLSPRQRQYATLFALAAAGLGLLWVVFAVTDSPVSPRSNDPARPSGVTNIGVLPAGAQVNPVDQWVGTAGRKLAQYESEREAQNRLNNDRQAFEQRTMQRFAELEQKLGSATKPATAPPKAEPSSPTEMPPAASLPPAPVAAEGVGRELALPDGIPQGFAASPSGVAMEFPPAPAPAPIPTLTRVRIAARSEASPQSGQKSVASTPAEASGTIATFLPVSITRGVLLGGLDAPTGGQSQSNPHPVLIRLSDNSILPNRFRAQYRECFVIAAGYGDISSERAYLRTESLSCVRGDGQTLEVRIQGSVYGEDGKVGMRGRLVSKQGQMLANALLAGVVSGIGQGIANSSTDYSTSALGTVASSSGSDAYRAGLGTGVGRALDRLAQYYIRLAENTFPVIEVDAGRQIDVVITKGTRIDVPISTAQQSTSSRRVSPERHYLEVDHDLDY